MTSRMTPRNQTLVGVVTDCRMVTTIQLENGRTVKLGGNLSKDTVVEIHCTDVLADGTCLGFEKAVVISRRTKSLEDKADGHALLHIPLAEEVELSYGR